MPQPIIQFKPGIQTLIKKHPLQEKENLIKMSKVLSNEEVDQLGMILNRAEDSRVQKSLNREEFDDLNFEDDYLTNHRAINSYLRAKKNDSEVRIVGGTTEKKSEVLVNELLSLNMQHEIRSFDREDMEIRSLGSSVGDIVTRSNEIELEEDKRPDMILELIGQRALFVEEIYADRSNIKRSRFDMRTVGTAQESFSTGKTSIRRIQQCEKRIIPATQVFLGDVTLPSYLFHLQPYIIKYERMNFEMAKSIYGRFANFKFVSAGANSGSYGGVFDYRIQKGLEKNEVEIWHYQAASDDEYQIIINGVPMLPPKTALPWEHPGYNMTMTVLKPMGRNFAYGKPVTASAKTLQGLSDEMMRNLVRKFRQAISPPMGVDKRRKGKVYSRDIFEAGNMIYGVTKENFSSLIDHRGVTESEFAMYQFIEKKAEEFIGQSNLSQGIADRGDQTATEIERLRQAGIKNLGLAIFAWSKAVRDMTRLRIFNLIENDTFPVGKKKNSFTNQIEDVYKRFTIHGSQFEDGRIGKKIVNFSDRDLDGDEENEIDRFEDKQQKLGKNVEITSINIKKLREIPIQWFVTAKSKPKQTTELDQAMFREKLVQGVGVQKVTGRPINPDKVTEEFETVWDTKNFFQKQAPQPQGAEADDREAFLNKLGGQIDELNSADVATQLKEGATQTPGARDLQGQAG